MMALGQEGGCDRASSLQNVCHTLWCSVGMTCHSKLDPAVDGTKCGPGKVGMLPPQLSGGGLTHWASALGSSLPSVQQTPHSARQGP